MQCDTYLCVVKIRKSSFVHLWLATVYYTDMTHLEDTTAFSKAYESLNTQQKEAVDAIEGPVMVIAGPGTGKTQILTLRIANILLKTDTQPENILAITFTESGATEMRTRLHTYIGTRAYRVPIYTFHAFAQHLINQHPDAFERIIGGKAATELQKVSLVEQILADTSVTLLRPIGNVQFYVRPVLGMISTLKREYITPDGLQQIINEQEAQLSQIPRVHEKGAHKGKVRSEYTALEKSIEKNRELLFVYRRYEALLRDERLYDFDDMIVETVRALEENESLRIELQETYQYVLADEHQDVNGSQNRIIELLCSYHQLPNIFVVGDEKQAIFRFQGASLENFLYFEDVFPKTRVIALTDNYRSGQVILDAAHSVVSVEDGPLKELRVPLVAADKEGVVEHRHFSHQSIEDAWVVSCIEEKLSAGVAPEDIAVIVRTNREVESCAALLEKQGISVVASSENDVLAHPVTHAVRSLITATAFSQNQEALFALVHASYWGVSRDDVVRVLTSVDHAHPLADLIADENALQEIGLHAPKQVHRIHQVLEEARRLQTLHKPHRVVEYLVRESGLLDQVIKEDPVHAGSILRRLYDEIEQMVQEGVVTTLADVHRAFARYDEFGIELEVPHIRVQKHAVRVLTAHKSKGLEFAYVYIPHVSDSVWGNRRSLNLFSVPLTKHLKGAVMDRLDDERRLFYVALTRAKRGVYLSDADVSLNGKACVTSRLLDDIQSPPLTVYDTTDFEEVFAPTRVLEEGENSLAFDIGLITQVLEKRGLSATALNNYLESPWNYLYRNVLRVPEIKSLSLLFGTAVHGVLERYTKAFQKDGAIPSATVLADMIKTQLQRLPLSDEEYTRLHEKALTALTVYTQDMASLLPNTMREEFSLRVMLPTGLSEFPEVVLTGKLDRIDLDENGMVAQVVDYKTGKPKSRNDIEGKTKTSQGNYKRQLVFYALLLSLYGDERYACKNGVISFVEPDSKGRVHHEAFTITDEEIEELKVQIIEVVRQIASGECLTTPCDESVCEYCHYAKLLQAKDFVG